MSAKSKILRRTALALTALASVSHLATAQGTPDPIHNVGERLFDNERLAVYEHRPYYANLNRFENESCRNNIDQRTHDVSINIVHKAGPDDVVRDDDQFRRLFEEQIFPKLQQRCANIRLVGIGNYVEGVRLSTDGTEFKYGEQLARGHSEIPLNRIFVRIDRGTFNYELMARNDEGSRTYASLAAYRRVKGERDARKNADLKAHEDELRRESKNGLEPSSEDLAVATSRFVMTPSLTCRNLAVNDWCEWSINVWLRLRGANRISCVPVTLGQDYHCTYTTDFQCVVRTSERGEGVDDHPFCAQWIAMRKVPAKTGMKRKSQGWELYPIPK